MGRFHIFTDGGGSFRWRLVAPNGKLKLATQRAPWLADVAFAAPDTGGSENKDVYL